MSRNQFHYIAAVGKRRAKCALLSSRGAAVGTRSICTESASGQGSQNEDVEDEDDALQCLTIGRLLRLQSPSMEIERVKTILREVSAAPELAAAFTREYRGV